MGVITWCVPEDPFLLTILKSTPRTNSCVLRPSAQGSDAPAHSFRRFSQRVSPFAQGFDGPAQTVRALAHRICRFAPALSRVLRPCSDMSQEFSFVLQEHSFSGKENSFSSQV